jgi:hypothetical protein
LKIAQRAADGGTVRRYAARGRGVQVFVYADGCQAEAFKKIDVIALGKSRRPSISLP